ncbi:hypothetical protein P4I85_15180 [Bacillus cereus]|uniref:hypothetical protein n=1 Tax=Bacillus cereus group sp. BfR-BA-01317 TaxID=2920294 RepID=UPI00188F1506|nr:hypothetical protein [Bacillus cereus group sp. BfR-BA-01317]MEB9422731.1 hypothetical protein [Bacillus cereus]MEB9508466.1 hypothetical protein [Bacillus cereus]MEB9561830.1 hypothetical protein [Bacillus cereus]MEC2466858.1 hypothetical protein [Bacillus cereus]
MKKETKIQLEGELEKVESDISNLEYHLVMMDGERQKTWKALADLKKRKKELKSYL